MLEQITVYEGQLSSYVPEEIEGASNCIYYAQNYRYLHKQQDQYYELKSLKIHPHHQKLHLTLYEDVETLKNPQISSKKKQQYFGMQKICDLVYQKSQQKQLKLPRTKNNIEIQITNELGVQLFGTLKFDYQQQTIVLFDRNGQKKGYMNYHIEQFTSQIRQHLPSDYNYSDSQQDSILLKRYGDQQFPTIKTILEEQSESGRTQTLSKMSEQPQRYSQAFQFKRQQKGDEIVYRKHIKSDASVKLEKMENIRALFVIKSEKQKNTSIGSQNSILKKSGYIKRFKKNKKVFPSSVFPQESKQQKQICQEDQKSNAQFRIKDKLNLISKNFQINIQNQPKKPKIRDLQYSYERILKKQKQLNEMFRTIDLVFNNVSVTLDQKFYGKKHLLLILQPFSYTTQPLYGNHLLWIGKGYNFRNILSFNSLTVIIKVTTDYGQQSTIAKQSIPISQILKDQNKSFHQSYLFNYQSQKIGVIILGFQVNKKDQIFDNKESRDRLHKQNRSSQNQSAKDKKTKRDSILSNSIIYQYIPKANKAFSLRSLTSQSRKKYQGGKNIKLSKANRFAEHKQSSPGPGQYKLNSVFNRYNS